MIPDAKAKSFGLQQGSKQKEPGAQCLYAIDFNLWQGGKGRNPGSIHQYVTRISECGQRGHGLKDDA
ncbi:hypothetical protein LR61_14885 [Morganella morganii]|nr:hypothetical protein LR61_14885 [Morganella morganii]